MKGIVVLIAVHYIMTTIVVFALCKVASVSDYRMYQNLKKSSEEDKYDDNAV